MTVYVGWSPQHDPSSDQYGQVYNGPTGFNGNDRGGYISTASAELSTWQRERFTKGIHPPVKAEIATQRAMRETGNGVFVQINGSTCGSVSHCQGGG
jgi:hypothetical protein